MERIVFMWSGGGNHSAAAALAEQTRNSEGDNFECKTHHDAKTKPTAAELIVKNELLLFFSFDSAKFRRR